MAPLKGELSPVVTPVTTAPAYMAPLKGELSPPFTAVTEGLPLRF